MGNPKKYLYNPSVGCFFPSKLYTSGAAEKRPKIFQGQVGEKMSWRRTNQSVSWWHHLSPDWSFLCSQLSLPTLPDMAVIQCQVVCISVLCAMNPGPNRCTGHFLALTLKQVHFCGCVPSCCVDSLGWNQFRSDVMQGAAVRSVVAVNCEVPKIAGFTQGEAIFRSNSITYTRSG